MNTSILILVLIAVVVCTPILISVGYRAGYLKALEKAEKIIEDIGRDMLRKKALKTGAPVRIDELPEKAGCDFCRDEQGYTIGNMYVCDKCGRQVP